MRCVSVGILAVVVFSGSLGSQGKGPERMVEGNVIRSERNPKARIRLPNSVQYAGTDRWVLYGVADCEVHVFVDADAQMNVRRLYWVQFESYLPTRPEMKYQYDSPRHASLGGMDFYVDTWIRSRDAKTRPGSDREHIQTLLRAKGYKMPEGMMDVRLVHLLDEQKRQELMIIYGEDLTAVTMAALQEGDKARDKWPATEKDLIERALKKMAITE